MCLIKFRDTTLAGKTGKVEDITVVIFDIGKQHGLVAGVAKRNIDLGGNPGTFFGRGQLPSALGADDVLDFECFEFHKRSILLDG